MHVALTHHVVFDAGITHPRAVKENPAPAGSVQKVLLANKYLETAPPSKHMI
jgi:hypothetical protein